MRTFRKMSLTTLALLVIAGIMTYHLSFWVDNAHSHRGSLFALMYSLAGMGIVAAVGVIAGVMNSEHFGSKKFPTRLLGWFGGIAAAGSFVALIVAMATSFYWVPDYENALTGKNAFDDVQFASILLAWLAGYFVTFFVQIFFHGSNSWVGASEKPDVSIMRMERGA